MLSSPIKLQDQLSNLWSALQMWYLILIHNDTTNQTAILPECFSCKKKKEEKKKENT